MTHIARALLCFTASESAGRFIRERLLGGTVPDLPIGVAAQVPDDPHRTLRDRMTLTRAEACWKCHQRMDDLGLPFENFDHYARFRAAELVRDNEASAANVDKKGKPLGPVLRGATLDTTGLIAASGDPRLDGPIRDPRELVQKLAASDRASPKPARTPRNSRASSRAQISK